MSVAIDGRAGHVSYDFSDRVVVVTGSSRGIGTRIAEAFALAGARIVLHGRDRDMLEHSTARIRATGADVEAVCCDLRSTDGARELIDTALHRFGVIDILINNAGGGFAQPLERMSPNGWRAILEVNLDSAFHCALASYPVFAEQGGGLIVNIGSVASSGAHPYRAAYSAAKAGIEALTMTMAWEWAQTGIRVNCVAPGAVATSSSRFADTSTAHTTTDYIPLQRLGEPDDIAQACLFLCSDGASYITGTTLRVDGGPRTALAADGLRCTTHQEVPS